MGAGDRAQKVFYICKNYDKLLDARQKAFLRMVTQNSSSDDFTRRVGGLVENAKRNMQWRKQYMEWEREKTYERDAGREEQALEDALMLIKKYNATPETAASDTGAPLDKVLEALKEPSPAN